MKRLAVWITVLAVFCLTILSTLIPTVSAADATTVADKFARAELKGEAREILTPGTVTTMEKEDYYIRWVRGYGFSKDGTAVPDFNVMPSSTKDVYRSDLNDFIWGSATNAYQVYLPAATREDAAQTLDGTASWSKYSAALGQIMGIRNEYKVSSPKTYAGASVIFKVKPGSYVATSLISSVREAFVEQFTNNSKTFSGYTFAVSADGNTWQSVTATKNVADTDVTDSFDSAWTANGPYHAFSMKATVHIPTDVEGYNGEYLYYRITLPGFVQGSDNTSMSKGEFQNYYESKVTNLLSKLNVTKLAGIGTTICSAYDLSQYDHYTEVPDLQAVSLTNDETVVSMTENAQGANTGSIRNNSNPGLRFRSSITYTLNGDVKTIAAGTYLETVSGTRSARENEFTVQEYGFQIVRKDKLTNTSLFANGVVSFEDVRADGRFMLTVPAATNFALESLGENQYKADFTAVITGMNDAQKDTVYVARPYVKCKDASGNDVVFYGNTSEASFNEIEEVYNNGLNQENYIYYNAEETGVEETAAQLLASVLSKSTGAVFTPKSMVGTVTNKNDILLGTISGEDVSDLGAEGYRITTHGDNIVIAGGEPRGVLYGTYKFLEKYYGFHQYTKTLQVIPENQSIVSASQVITEQYVPTFEYRETDWLTKDHNNVTGSYERYSATNFRVANGLNGSFSYAHIDNTFGGMFGYWGSFTHTMTTTFINKDVYFDSHPEWFAKEEDKLFGIIKGERHPNMLCLSNPDMRAKMIEEVKAACIQPSNYFKGEPFIIAVTQSDYRDNYCRCNECTNIANQYGGQSGLMLWFINQVAEEVQKEYPNVLIDTFAYFYTQSAPTGIKPRDNVIVRFAPLDCCYSHALNDPNCTQNKSFYQDLQAWSKLTDRLYIWGYSANYDCYNCVNPDFHILQKNMKVFRDNSVKGVYMQGNHTAHTSNSEFAELRGYLISRLLFDPDIDVEAETRGFMKAYYGSDKLYDFITLISERASSSCMNLNKSPATLLTNMTANDIAQANMYWENAKIATAENSPERNNVLRSELSWRFWMACNNVPGYSGAEINQKLYADFVNFGVTRYSEESLLATSGIDWNKSPETWSQ